MDIHNITVRGYQIDSIREKYEGITHIKTLPFLSVVQSVKGSYDIAIGKASKPEQTGEGGAFIAPSEIRQQIVHHDDPKSGIMEARWLFLDVVINDTERFDSRFRFPTILPQVYQNKLNVIFDALMQSGGICQDLSNIYLLLDILLNIAEEKPHYDRLTEDIVTYICGHFHEKINYSEFAGQVHVSVSNLFRKFKKEFNETPSCYINHYRILRASSLLENKNLSIKEIAFAVGFHDEFYFSKLFKNYMKISPQNYREKIKATQTR